MEKTHSGGLQRDWGPCRRRGRQLQRHARGCSVDGAVSGKSSAGGVAGILYTGGELRPASSPAPWRQRRGELCGRHSAPYRWGSRGAVRSCAPRWPKGVRPGGTAGQVAGDSSHPEDNISWDGLPAEPSQGTVCLSAEALKTAAAWPAAPQTAPLGVREGRLPGLGARRPLPGYLGVLAGGGTCLTPPHRQLEDLQASPPM